MSWMRMKMSCRSGSRSSFLAEANVRLSHITFAQSEGVIHQQLVSGLREKSIIHDRHKTAAWTSGRLAM